MWQGQVDFSVQATKPINLLSPGNSWGKTEHIARDILMRAWYKLDLDHRGMWWLEGDESWDEWERMDWRGLVCSFQYKTARESFERIVQWYERSDPIAAIIDSHSTTNPAWVKLRNGAVIDWGSLDEGGKHVEATRRRNIKVDEAGLIPDMRGIHGNILNPRTLGVAGKSDWYGTPKPATDEFVFEVFEAGQEPDHPRYFSAEGDARDNPFWPESDRARVMADPELVNQHDGSFTPLGRQVILGQFAQAGRKWFLRRAVWEMFTGAHSWYVAQPTRIHLPGRKDEYRRPLVFQAWDLGGSRPGGDATVGLTGVVHPGVLPYRVIDMDYIEAGDADWKQKYDRIEAAFKKHHPQQVAVDVTGPTADAVQEELERRQLPIEGIHFGGSSAKKHDMVRGLQADIEARWDYDEVTEEGVQRKQVLGKWRWPDPEHYMNLVDRRTEFYRYRYPDDKKLRQDTVMAMGMLAMIVRDNAPPPSRLQLGPDAFDDEGSLHPDELRKLAQRQTGFADIDV